MHESYENYYFDELDEINGEPLNSSDDNNGKTLSDEPRSPPDSDDEPQTVTDNAQRSSDSENGETLSDSPTNSSDSENGETQEETPQKVEWSDDSDNDDKTTGGEKNKNLTQYDPFTFVSKCCNAFIFYSELSVYCSKCGKEVYTIKDGENITIGIKYNNVSKSNISGDVLSGFYNKLKRFSTDKTCDICAQICPKCSQNMRYLRDPQGNIVYVCSNAECREILI